MNMNNASSKDIADDAKRHIWYPFTQMQDFISENQTIIESGDKNHLIDINGKRYLDGVSSLWTNVHGHRKAALDQAIKDQIGKIAHSTLLGLSNVPAIECAKKLIQIAPDGLTRVFYSDSGSTAVEIALKMAFQYQQQTGQVQRKKFIALENAYHGDTIGSVSVGGIDLFHEIYGPLLFESIKVPSPYCYRCPLDHSQPDCRMACADDIEAKLIKHGDEICAFVIEPLVQGAAGILTQPPGYLKKVAELCKKFGILLIVDEVATGFGKTGAMFACQKAGIIPDIMAVAKGISGGYLPLAATLTTEAIYEGFLGRYEEFKTFFHGHTYTGNPLACAAAIANMEIFEEENVLGRLQPKIKRLKKNLEHIEALPYVGQVRQEGLMVGIELVADKTTKAPYPPQQKIGHRVILEARKKGLIIRPLGNVVVLMPPLSISEDEIDTLCTITMESIISVTQS